MLKDLQMIFVKGHCEVRGVGGGPMVVGWGSQVQGVFGVTWLCSHDFPFLWQVSPDMFIWWIQRCKSMQTQSFRNISSFYFCTFANISLARIGCVAPVRVQCRCSVFLQSEIQEQQWKKSLHYNPSTCCIKPSSQSLWSQSLMMRSKSFRYHQGS